MNQFDNDTRMVALEQGRMAGHVHAVWSIGSNPNGGYLLSLAVAALREAASAHRDPLSVTAHYLRPALAGQACTVNTTMVRSGRSLSTLRGTLTQDGAARIEVLAALGDLAEQAPPVLTVAAPQIPAPEACVPRSGAQQGVMLPLLEMLDIRLDPSTGPLGTCASGGGSARIAGWIRFRDGRAPDALACILFADAFPPAVFSVLGPVGWVPTIELTVHLRARPAPGWILGQFVTVDMQDGRLIEDGALWDSQGTLVSQSRQLALLLDPARRPPASAARTAQ
ncbi:MAG: thioesterase family protein [Burkholderiaceae bacterium]